MKKRQSEMTISEVANRKIKKRIAWETISVFLLIIIMVTVVCLIYGWGTIGRPAAMLTIKNALSAKNFTITEINSKNEELYSIKYCNGVYYQVSGHSLSVWTFNDDGETVKFLSAPLNGRDEQTVLNSLQTVQPRILDISDMDVQLYLIDRAIAVDKSSLTWTGDVKSVADLADKDDKGKPIHDINAYGAKFEVPNQSMTCITAYKLMSLKLNKISIVCYGELMTGVTTVFGMYSFNISKINKSKFDFKFMDSES